MARILIIAKGSYGDLFPMYALAERLLADGHRVVFATQRCHQKAAALTGATVALFEPPDQEIRQRSITIWTFLSPERLKDEVDRLMVVARGMDLIIGNQLALFGSVVAERLGTPWMYCPVSPLAFPSRFRSALLPYLHWLQRLTGRSPRLQPAYLWLSRTLGGWTLESVARQRRTLLPGDCLHPT
jgi:UDP:flavonoid glycosyltransferase YjiC (YdhE family)